jgi:hypothetical protein
VEHDKVACRSVLVPKMVQTPDTHPLPTTYDVKYASLLLLAPACLCVYAPNKPPQDPRHHDIADAARAGIRCPRPADKVCPSTHCGARISSPGSPIYRHRMHDTDASRALRMMSGEFGLAARVCSITSLGSTADCVVHMPSHEGARCNILNFPAARRHRRAPVEGLCFLYNATPACRQCVSAIDCRNCWG